MTNGGLSNFDISSTTVYTATFTPNADGAVTINVPANSFTDAALNYNTPATEYIFIYDSTYLTIIRFS